MTLVINVCGLPTRDMIRRRMQSLKSLHRETPQNNPRGNLFSCDQGHDGCANATCHDEHIREMDEKRSGFDPDVKKGSGYTFNEF